MEALHGYPQILHQGSLCSQLDMTKSEGYSVGAEKLSSEDEEGEEGEELRGNKILHAGSMIGRSVLHLGCHIGLACTSCALHRFLSVAAAASGGKRLFGERQKSVDLPLSSARIGIRKARSLDRVHGGTELRRISRFQVQQQFMQRAHGLSALARAAQQGDATEVQRLIEAGADVELQDQTRYRRRPLHYAAENGHVEVLERLLAARATVEAEDRDGYRPLHLAASKGRVEVLERLLAARATVEAEDRDGQRPLHLAASKGHVEVLERLLAAKATVDAEDKYGHRPLHFAAHWGQVEVLERLLAARATVEAENKNGRGAPELGTRPEGCGD
ncbi:unnamed protein product, partial [Durusdinium trenchii]